MPLLTELLPAVTQPVHLTGDIACMIDGITADSRAVKERMLFAAIPGSAQDGAAYIPDAMARGAAAILCHDAIALPATSSAALVYVQCSNVRLALAQLAAAYYPRRPDKIIAVTGTNGKTSIADFYRQLWALDGADAASIGTLGLRSDHADLVASYPSGSTSPDPVLLAQTLDQLAAHGVTHLAIEASSHGLDQYRLDAIGFAVAIFTNLTQDHLDYHETMDAYFAAKARLFFDLPTEPHAIINADDAYGQRVIARCEAENRPHSSYGMQGKTLRIVRMEPVADGLKADIEWGGKMNALHLPLFGAFQLDNLCATMLAAHETGMKKQVVLDHLPQLRGVRGRMEWVATHPSGAAIFVDYAHTPDALEQVLKSLRPHCSKKLHLVFGCGGNRDQGKRSKMGTIAARLADRIIVTDDNPREEESALIRRMILQAITDTTASVEEIGDRKDAIYAAVQQLQKGDLLVVAGKGHETYQILGGRTIEFNDAAIVREALKTL